MAETTENEELFWDLFNDTDYKKTSNFSELVPLYVLVPISGIYGIIFVTGILGNISTCIAIRRYRSMRTATNFYLFSLSISDLLLLTFGLPLQVYLLWNRFLNLQIESLRISVLLISETSAIATVSAITALTIERYIAICHVSISHKMSKLSRVVKIIIAIWIMSLCAALSQVMQFGITTNENDEQTISACIWTGFSAQPVFVLYSFIFVIIQLSTVAVLYVLIGMKLNTSTVLHSNPRMLVVVALSFFVCWIPFHLQRLIGTYDKNLEQPNDTFYQIYTSLIPFTGALYFVSTAIKPFLYYKMSTKFRNAFKLFKQSNLFIVNKESESCFLKKLSAGRFSSSQRFSRLHEEYHKQIGEKLATYSYQAESKLEVYSWETTV